MTAIFTRTIQVSVHLGYLARITASFILLKRVLFHFYSLDSLFSVFCVNLLKLVKWYPRLVAFDQVYDLVDLVEFISINA